MSVQVIDSPVTRGRGPLPLAKTVPFVRAPFPCRRTGRKRRHTPIVQAPGEGCVPDQDILAELLRRDAAGDPEGAAQALLDAKPGPADAVFAVYQLLLHGRFRAAQLAARRLASAGINHLVTDLARALGEALFEKAGGD